MAIKIHSYDQFQRMRDAGRLTASVLDYITPYVVEGISTRELDVLCHNYILKHNAIPSPLEKGFPKSICTSLNHVVCHGIPSDEKLSEGDILNIDICLKLNGWHGDSSRMFTIGKISRKAQRLVEVTKQALEIGIKCVRPGVKFGEIGRAIEVYVLSNNFSVVKDFCGHGIGELLHDEPQVLHYGTSNFGPEIQEGMFFTIEPMVNAGREETIISIHDGWSVTTRDKSLSAQWEHTLGVTKDGVEIFTLSPSL